MKTEIILSKKDNLELEATISIPKDSKKNSIIQS